MLDLNNVRYFIKIVQLTSISQAAEYFGEPKSKLSRRMQHLEQQIGARLFIRQANKLELTTMGRELYHKFASVIDHAESLVITPLGDNSEASGKVKLSIAADIANTHFTQTLNYFCSLYPQIQLDCAISAHPQQVAISDYDVAIIISDHALEDADYIAKALFAVPMGIYASPEYLAQTMPIEQAADLAQQQCICHTRADKWYFQTGPAVQVGGQMRIDSLIAQQRAAEDHLGLVRLPHFIAKHTPQLQQLQLTQELEPFTVYLAYQERTLLPPAVKLMINFLTKVAPELEQTVLDY